MSDKNKDNEVFDDDLKKAFEEDELFQEDDELFQEDDELSIFEEDNDDEFSIFEEDENNNIFEEEENIIEEENDLKEEQNVFEEENDSKEEQNVFEEENDSVYKENPNNRDELFEDNSTGNDSVYKENPNNRDELFENKDKQKNEEEIIKKENSNNNFLTIFMAMIITSLLSISGSWFLINHINKDENKINDIKNDLDIQKGLIVKIQNDSIKVKSTLENSELIKENIKREFSEIKESFEKEIENKKNNKKYFEILLASNSKNIKDINEIKEKIENLPISTGQIEKRFISLENEIKNNGTNKSITIELASLKEEIKKQKEQIADITDEKRRNDADLNKIRYEYNELKQKTFKNSQYIAENRKAVKNNLNKINGESDVKNLLEQAQASKDVRAVSLLFDKNRVINIESEKKGYKIIGSIASEVVFIDDGNDDHSTYHIGDYLDGYGKILKIGDNGTVETENGIVKNLNTIN